MTTEATRVLIFANVALPPFVNNLLPPILAFQRAAHVTVVEPHRLEGFVGTGGARPAPIPDTAIARTIEECAPDVVVCLAGGLFLAPSSLQRLPSTAVTVGVALSDPLGLDASLAIAPLFDLFYTQDPQTVPTYQARGIPVGRCDLASDGALFHPMGLAPEWDVIFYGKWTPYRDAMLAALARKVTVRLHAHAGESRWSVPPCPPLDEPDALCAAINRARLSVEFARLDDAAPPFQQTWRATPRLHYAATCGVPSLVEASDRLEELYAPGVEVETYTSAEDLVTRAVSLLADEPRRRTMGIRARARALQQHTWDHRIASIMANAATVRGTRGAGTRVSGQSAAAPRPWRDRSRQHVGPVARTGGASIRDHGRLLLVYPAHGNAFYAGLAARLHAACATFLDQVAVVSSLELCALPQTALLERTVGVVNPYECALTGRAVVERIQLARRRIAMLAEAVGTEWYTKQFSLPIQFDAVFDVGFVSQAGRHEFQVPYRFVPNGPTEQERAVVTACVHDERPIPWAMVGHYTEARLALGSGLVERCDPRGVLFLPRLRPVRPDHGLISPVALRELLTRTRYYVWCTHHRFAYYESFRFVDALLAGAVPCKIDDAPGVADWGIPATFPTLDAFCATARDGASDSLFKACREFYLGIGDLGAHMREALESVA